MYCQQQISRKFVHGPLRVFYRFAKHAAVTYQNRPGGFVVAVILSSRFGLLNFVTVDPTPQLMGQPAKLTQCVFAF